MFKCLQTIAGALLLSAAMLFGWQPAHAGEGPVAHWPFDDGENPTADIVAGNDGTLNGTLNGDTAFVVQDLDGTVNDIAPISLNVDALDFGGVAADFVEAADNATLDLPGSFTIAAWVNVRSLNITAFIVTKEKTATPAEFNYSLAIRFTNNPVFFVSFAESNATTIAVTNNLGFGACNSRSCFSTGISDFTDGAHPFGTWRHLVGVYDATSKTVSVYLDGIKDGETTFDPSGNIPLSGDIRTNNDPVTIGKRGTTTFGIGATDGQIDDVRIYNRALSDTEIALLGLEITPTEAIANLIDDINSLGLPIGLTAPLQNVAEILDDNNPNNDAAACGNLQAFINQVNAQERRGELTAEEASELRQLAETSKSSLGC